MTFIVDLNRDINRFKSSI